MKNENEGLVKKHDALPIVSMFYDIVPTSSISKIELVVQVDLGDRRVEKRGVVFEPDFYTEDERLKNDVNNFLEYLTMDFCRGTGYFTWFDKVEIVKMYDKNEPLEDYAQKVFNRFCYRRDFEREFEQGTEINVDNDVWDEQNFLNRYAIISVLDQTIELYVTREADYETLVITDSVKIKKNGEVIFEESVTRITFEDVEELENIELYDYYLPDPDWTAWFDTHPLISEGDGGIIYCGVDELAEMYKNRAIEFLKDEISFKEKPYY